MPPESGSPRDPFAGLSEEERELLEERPHPDWMEPMLATLTEESFSDPDWIYERKLDGERCLVFKNDGRTDGEEVRLRSRNRKSLNEPYPELVEAFGAMDADDFVADGEVVAFEGGVTSFSELQGRMKISDPEEARASDVRVYVYLFDLLHLAGHDLTALPLRSRKELLRRALDFDDPVRFTRHRNEEGEAFHRQACEKGWEGVIAKDAGSGYVHGRSRKWLKFKCVERQELVIAGFTEPEGERLGFGALLVGFYDGDDLVYAGKVGTGYDDQTLEDLRRRLDGLERKTCPYDAGDPPEGTSGVHWVTPKLVAEVGFTEWTDDRRLRHPRFLGLRRDKDPGDVVRETPAT